MTAETICDSSIICIRASEAAARFTGNHRVTQFTEQRELFIEWDRAYTTHTEASGFYRITATFNFAQVEIFSFNGKVGIEVV